MMKKMRGRKKEDEERTVDVTPAIASAKQRQSRAQEVEPWASLQEADELA